MKEGDFVGVPGGSGSVERSRKVTEGTEGYQEVNWELKSKKGRSRDFGTCRKWYCDIGGREWNWRERRDLVERRDE